MSNSKADARKYYRRRQQRRQQPEAPETPVLAVGEDQLGPAFQILMERLDMMGREMRILAQTVEAMKETDPGRQRVVQQEIVAEKSRAVDAIAAAREGILAANDQYPMDPATRESILGAAMREAAVSAEAKKAAFTRYLASLPTGTIISSEERAVPLIINGVAFIIKPGKNDSVPEPFLRLWAERAEMVQYAEERRREIAGQHSFGDLEAWRSDGRWDADLLT